jgi:hypothetical protein
MPKAAMTSSAGTVQFSVQINGSQAPAMQTAEATGAGDVRSMADAKGGDDLLCLYCAVERAYQQQPGTCREAAGISAEWGCFSSSNGRWGQRQKVLMTPPAGTEQSCAQISGSQAPTMQTAEATGAGNVRSMADAKGSDDLLSRHRAVERADQRQPGTCREAAVPKQQQAGRRGSKA